MAFLLASASSCVIVRNRATARAKRSPMPARIPCFSRLPSNLAVASLLLLGAVACDATTRNPSFCETDADCLEGERCSLPTNTCVSSRLALDPTGFFVTDERWFASESGPVLRGTFEPAADPVIRAFVGTTPIGAAATIDGTSWSLALPDGTITRSDVEIHVQLVGDGRTTEIVQAFALDDEAPAIEVIDSIFRDERSDAIDFATGEPVHGHAGPSVVLGARGCPQVAKHAYLLDEAPPAHGRELTPNPLAWRYRVTERAGLDLAASTYRVETAAGEPLLDATAVPEVQPDGDFVIALHRRGTHGIAALGDTPGEYRLIVRFVDWAGHAAETSVCWDHVPLAAPLLFEQAGIPDRTPGVPGHDMALHSLGLDPPTQQRIAERLLNRGNALQGIPRSLGASASDIRVTNLTAEPVFLRVSVTPPPSVRVSRQFTLRNAVTNATTVNDSCDPLTGDPNLCAKPPSTKLYPQFDSALITQSAATPGWGIRVVASSGSDTFLAPCEGCSGFHYEIPPRVAGEPPRSFQVMTVVGFVQGAVNPVGHVVDLIPVDAARPDVTPEGVADTRPYSDPAITTVRDGVPSSTVRISGKTYAAVTGCTKQATIANKPFCTERSTIVPYRSLTFAQLSLNGDLATSYATSINPDLPAVVQQTQVVTPAAFGTWSRSKAVFPPAFTP
jgi:hypothetical protein